ncbi:MAG: TolC family protein [Gemmatimonadales bacterium]|nr:TolC family protein [Gemmatimonadales bacterium]
MQVILFAAAIAGLALTLAGRRLSAQDAPGADSLLARLTAEALAANPSLGADRALARAATARVRPAGALPDPMLSIGVMNLTLPRFAFRESDFTEVDVELSQEFPWPGTLGARTSAARADARALESTVADRRRQVSVRAAALYYRLRYVAAAHRTLARQRSLLAAAVEISTARYATTSAPQSDPLQARVALARLDTEEADLTEEDAELRAELRALRNRPAGDSLRIEPVRPELTVTATHIGRTRGDIVAAESLTYHPRVAARLAAVEAAEQTARVERLAARPDFTLMTRYGARPLGSDFFSAFVGVRLPLFAGRKQHRLAEAAEADADAARAAVAEETAALAAELESTRARVAAGERRLRLLVDQVVPAARATAEASLRSYRVGQVDFLNVLAAEDARYRADLDAAREASEHLTHLVMLQQLLAREDDQ